MKAYIWGTGKNSYKVLKTIRLEHCCIKGFIDNDPSKRGKIFENKKIYFFKDIIEEYDILIISVQNYEAILYQLKLEGFNDFSKILIFWDITYCDDPQYSHIMDQQKWKIILLEQKIRNLEAAVSARFENIGYEIIDGYNKNLFQYPCIGSTEEAVDKIVNERCSMIRYGDGEFELMAGKERLIYQNCRPKLAKRLKEIIASRDEQLLIGIANNYGTLNEYTEDCANGIRVYMDEETRKFHMSVLEKSRVYYDAYMFKCYLPYRNRKDTWKRVKLIKSIWDNRDVVIVEGEKTRTGYGNNLFDNAKSIKRILVPMKNAFDRYTEILEAVLQIKKSCLILVVLGPTANLLVYDLMKKGYQAIDIGQIDMDYEWYRVGAKKRVPIPDRYVSQLPPTEIKEVEDINYLRQIIKQINI